jgi:PKD repeat protein
VTSWSWDFDGDGTEDSDAQNPEYTFKNSEGEHYNVSLVISNGINTDTIRRSGYVRVLPYNGNLALLGRATASSEQDILHNPQKTIDDDAGTQWISKRTNSEWLKIELNSVYSVGKLVIKWVYGSGSEYSIQTSLNDTDWQTVFVENAGDGSTDTVLLTQPVEAKFLKLQGADTGKSYKHSVIEFEVYQSDETGIENFLNLESDLRIYPNPSGEQIIIDFGEDVIREAEINIVDMQGRLHYREVCEPGPVKKTLNISKLPDGIYVIRIYIGETVLTKKFVKY